MMIVFLSFLFFFFAQRLKGNVLLEEWIVSVGI